MDSLSTSSFASSFLENYSNTSGTPWKDHMLWRQSHGTYRYLDFRPLSFFLLGPDMSSSIGDLLACCPK